MRLIFLLGLWMGSISAAWAGGTDQLRSFWRETRTLEGRFIQSVTDNTGRKRDAQGSFALQRPNQFRWQVEKPYAQLLIADGQRLWSFDPDLRQATVHRQHQRLGDSPAAVLAGGAIDRHFTLRDIGSADGLDIVDVQPQSAEGSFTRIRIGLSANRPRLLEIHDHFGQVSTILLQNMRTTGRFPADYFRFTPPPGVDVVGEAAQP
jgi:outer membrane lipoprotein carrier protein